MKNSQLDSVCVELVLHRQNHYSNLRTVELVAAQIECLEIGKLPQLRGNGTCGREASSIGFCLCRRGATQARTGQAAHGKVKFRDVIAKLADV